MTKENWERKLFYLLTPALMGDPFPRDFPLPRCFERLSMAAAFRIDAVGFHYTSGKAHKTLWLKHIPLNPYNTPRNRRHPLQNARSEEVIWFNDAFHKSLVYNHLEMS